MGDTPLDFTLNALTISINANEISLDNYTAPIGRNGILLNASIPLSLCKKTFMYLTDSPSISLHESLTSVKYAVLPILNGTTESPTLHNHKNILPTNLDVGFTLPTAEGYTITRFTSNSSSDLGFEFDTLNYIAANTLYTTEQLATALALTPPAYENGSLVSAMIPGIINSKTFRQSLIQSADDQFVSKLTSLGLNAEGTGRDYIANPSNDALGNPLPLHPSLEIARKLFNEQPERLKTIESPMAQAAATAAGVKAGLTAHPIPLKVGDVLDYNIVISTSQKNKSGATIDNRTYKVRLAVVADPVE